MWVIYLLLALTSPIQEVDTAINNRAHQCTARLLQRLQPFDDRNNRVALHDNVLELQGAPYHLN